MIYDDVDNINNNCTIIIVNIISIDINWWKLIVTIDKTDEQSFRHSV